MARAAASATSASVTKPAVRVVPSASRFVPPAYNCNTLRRPRLEQQICDAVKTRAATIVAAPAGYGKSLLVAKTCETLEKQGARIAWIHLDKRDNSYERFVQTLDLLFRPKHSAKKGAVAEAPTGPRRGRADTYLLQWLEALSDEKSPYVIILDDYEVVNDPAVHQLVDALITSFIPHVHTLILSRVTPPLSFSMLRHRRQLLTLGSADLSFSADEIRSLLKDHFQHDVSEHSLSIIQCRTEGWPVAVQLVGMALSQRQDSTTFIENLSGCDTDVADFLNGEVLSRQPADLVDFLMRISPLTRVSAPLCAAVTGIPDAARLLDQTVRANLLLFPIDRNNIWFRFHPLFREYLNSQLARHSEILRDDILRPAMEWSEVNDLPADAINYGLELTDNAGVAKLIVQHADRFVLTTGEHSLFLDWMNRLQLYLEEDAFDLKYYQAWSLVISLKFHEAKQAFSEMNTLYAASKSNPPDAKTRKKLARLGIIDTLIRIFDDKMIEARGLAADWLEMYTEAEPFDKISMSCCLAGTCCATSEFELSKVSLQNARSAAVTEISPFEAAWVGSLEGHTALSAGDYRLARSILLPVFESTSHELGYASSVLSTVSLFLSDACYGVGDLEGASKYLKFGLPHIHDHGLIESAAAGCRVMIRTKYLESGFDEALNACYHCESIARHRPNRLSLLVLYEKVHLVLRHGRVSSAVEYTGFDGEHFRSAILAVRGTPEELSELVSTLIKIRVLIALNRHERALRLVSPLLAWATRQARRAYVVELLILRSIAEAAIGKPQQAHRSLLEACGEAMQVGMTQIFRDEGDALSPLIEVVVPMLIKRPDYDPAFVNAIACSAQAIRSSTGEVDETPPAEPLSSREIQILQLLDSGMTNEGVAAHLFLSLRTVKWYLYNIYPKLGVKNRTGALAKARRLRMI